MGATNTVKQDPRLIASYTIPEVAHYLLVAPATLRSWVLGGHYPVAGGKAFFNPPIPAADAKGKLLSFVNLVEVHVLVALRRDHEIPLQQVRKALRTLHRIYPSPHPLVDHRFETDGINLFVEKYGRLINLSQQGQLSIKEVLRGYLRRVEWGKDGIPTRLYPFTRHRSTDEPRAVVIDPRIEFGRPVLAGTGIATSIIAERYKAGESVEQLAEDYGRAPLEIQEAVRCELSRQAA